MKIPKSVKKYILRKKGHWIWTGPMTKDNHPQCHVGERTLKIIPFIYRAATEDSSEFRLRPIDKVCRELNCVNPEHYEKAPHRPEIVMPGVGKGNNPAGRRGIQSRFGVLNGRVKLEEHQVVEIRKLRQEGQSLTELSKKFLISSVQVGRIVNKVNWPHV